MSDTNEQTNKDYSVETKQLEGSQVEISGELEASAFAKYRDSAIAALSENADIDGFRKGAAPQEVIEKQLGEEKILHEMAQRALSKMYPEILQDEHIDAIGQPEISITKIAHGSPLGFSIKTATLPSFTLPDYKALAKEVGTADLDGIEVTDEEVEQTVTQIRQMRAQQEKQQQGESKEDDAKESADSDAQDKEELPELDDEFVKTLGDFESVDDFKAKLRENIKTEKTNKEREKKRIEMIEKIIDATDIDLPEILIDSETENLLHRLKGDLSQSGLSFEDYTKQTGKTEDDIKKDLRDDAKKRAKMQLIINKIATQEEISPNKEAVEQQVNQLLEQYKDADPHRTRGYVESMLLAEEVFTFLEKTAAGE